MLRKLVFSDGIHHYTTQHKHVNSTFHFKVKDCFIRSFTVHSHILLAYVSSWLCTPHSKESEVRIVSQTVNSQGKTYSPINKHETSLRVTISAMKHHNQSSLGEEKVYLAHTSPKQRNSGQ